MFSLLLSYFQTYRFSLQPWNTTYQINPLIYLPYNASLNNETYSNGNLENVHFEPGSFKDFNHINRSFKISSKRTLREVEENSFKEYNQEKHDQLIKMIEYYDDDSYFDSVNDAFTFFTEYFKDTYKKLLVRSSSIELSSEDKSVDNSFSIQDTTKMLYFIRKLLSPCDYGCEDLNDFHDKITINCNNPFIFKRYISLTEGDVYDGTDIVLGLKIDQTGITMYEYQNLAQNKFEVELNNFDKVVKNCESIVEKNDTLFYSSKKLFITIFPQKSNYNQTFDDEDTMKPIEDSDAENLYGNSNSTFVTCYYRGSNSNNNFQKHNNPNPSQDCPTKSQFSRISNHEINHKLAEKSMFKPLGINASTQPTISELPNDNNVYSQYSTDNLEEESIDSNIIGATFSDSPINNQYFNNTTSPKYDVIDKLDTTTTETSPLLTTETSTSSKSINVTSPSDILGTHADNLLPQQNFTAAQGDKSLISEDESFSINDASSSTQRKNPTNSGILRRLSVYFFSFPLFYVLQALRERY